MNEIIKECTETAKKLLVNKRIKAVRYMTDNEMEFLGWSKRPLVLALDDTEGTVLWVSCDVEGNDGGAIHYTSMKESSGVIPTF
jgi:hypothetical protein